MVFIKSPFANQIGSYLPISFTDIYNKLLKDLLLLISYWIKLISLLVNSSIDYPHDIFNMYPWPDEVEEDKLEWFISTFLSIEDGADFNTIDSLEWSPMCKAIYIDNIEIVKYLIYKYKDTDLNVSSCSFV